MDREEFAEDRQINPGQLDLEAACQADLFFKWAERAVESRGELDRAKFSMDVTEARLALQCREHPEEFSLSKVTEGAITAAVKTHDIYIGACRVWLRARETSAMLDKAVEAMEQRKRMIEVLITLHGQQYFAGPSVPRDLVSAWQERQEKGSAELEKKQTARARGEKRRKNDA